MAAARRIDIRWGLRPKVREDERRPLGERIGERIGDLGLWGPGLEALRAVGLPLESLSPRLLGETVAKAAQAGQQSAGGRVCYHPCAERFQYTVPSRALPTENYPACGVPTTAGRSAAAVVAGIRCPDCGQQAESLLHPWEAFVHLVLAPGAI